MAVSTNPNVLPLWGFQGGFDRFVDVEADGDTTLLAFSDLQVNTTVSAQRFRIDLPGDVVVSQTFNGFSLGQRSF